MWENLSVSSVAAVSNQESRLTARRLPESNDLVDRRGTKQARRNRFPANFLFRVAVVGDIQCFFFRQARDLKGVAFLDVIVAGHLAIINVEASQFRQVARLPIGVPATGC